MQTQKTVTRMIILAGSTLALASFFFAGCTGRAPNTNPDPNLQPNTATLTDSSAVYSLGDHVVLFEKDMPTNGDSYEVVDVKSGEIILKKSDQSITFVLKKVSTEQ